MTSKPSSTNCPRLSSQVVVLSVVDNFNNSFCYINVSNPILGGYCGGVPPLPIPNREVKPACADGTAMQCGRVGSRLLLSRASITKVVGAFLRLSFSERFLGFLVFIRFLYFIASVSGLFCYDYCCFCYNYQFLLRF